MTRRRDVDVVFFDLDDTLFAHRLSARDGLAKYLTAAGGDMAAADPDAEYRRWWTLEEEHYPRYLSGELDFRGQRRARSRAFVASFGMELPDDDAADTWFGEYFRLYEESWQAHADALPCLDALKPRRVGIVTNAELDIQLRKLIATGLHGRVEHIVASAQFGVRKPVPAIFLHACELFGVPPERAAHVGDRFHTDAVGATDAGLLGIWLDRPGSTLLPEVGDVERREAAERGIPVIAGLEELAPLLNQTAR